MWCCGVICSINCGLTVVSMIGILLAVISDVVLVVVFVVFYRRKRCVGVVVLCGDISVAL